MKYLRNTIDVLNENRGKPIEHEITESPIIIKHNDVILPIGQQVRTLLNYSSDITGKKQMGVRGGDVRWSGIKKISNIIMKDGYPPMYEVNNESNTLYTSQQLQTLRQVLYKY